MGLAVVLATSALPNATVAADPTEMQDRSLPEYVFHEPEPTTLPDPGLHGQTTQTETASPRNKFEAVLIAARPIADGLDPEIIATIAIHESSRTGRYGFGLVDGRDGYRSHSDPEPAISEFMELVSGPGRYEGAWYHRSESGEFLRRLVVAGYAEDRGVLR